MAASMFSSVHGAPHSSWPERMYTSLQQGLFSLGFTFSREVADDSRWLFIAPAIISEAQTLSFVLNDANLLPWAKSRLFSPIVASISFLSEPFDPERNPTGYLVVLALAAGFVACFLALATHAARNFVLELPQAPYLIKALRLIASASTGVLFLPVASFLFRGASCPNDDRRWLRTAVECGSPAHMVLSTVFSILTLGFSALSLFVAAVFVDRRPDSQAWGAVSTGRAAVINLCLRLGLSFSFSVLRNQVVGTTAFTLLLILIGAAKVYQYAVWAPYTHRDINAFFAASGGAFTTAAGSLLVAQYISSQAAIMGVFLGIPLTAILVYSLVRQRLDAVGRQPLQRCQSVSDMHLWGRRRLQRRAILRQVLERVNTDGEAHGGSAFVPESSSPHRSDDGLEAQPIGAGDLERDSAGRHKHGPGSAPDSVMESDTEDGVSIVSLKNDGASITHARRRGRGEPRGFAIPTRIGSADYRGVHLQSAEHLNAEQLRAEMIQLEREARRAYEGAAETFSTDEQAFIGLSIFERSTSRYRYRECVALSQALRCSPPLDSRYYIAQRVRDMRESDGVGLSSVDRVLFDSALRETSQLRVVAYQLLVRMFTHLTVNCPDLSDLLDTSVALHTTVERADEAYRRLFSFHNDNATLLRQYAGYLSDFRADQTRVTELLNQAQRVQEQSRKQKQKIMRTIRFGALQPEQSRFDESAAIITISAAPFRLGEILHASQSACRLFNYAPHQIIGQNVSIVVPHPIDGVHNQMLQAFSKRNRKSRVVGQTRLLFARRKGGTIMPVWIAVNEAPPDQATAEPRFTAEISPVTTDQNFILFGGAQQNFQIYAASAGSLRLIGVEAEDIETDVISMTQYFPSVDSTFREHVKLEPDHIKAIAMTSCVSDLFQCLGRSEVLRQHGTRGGGGSRVRVHQEADSGAAGAGRHMRKIQSKGSFGNGTRSVDKVGREHFVQGSGKTAQIKEATTGPCAHEALIRSMQHLQKPGLIPVRTRSGETLVVGQVQVAKISLFGAINILGWHEVHRRRASKGEYAHLEPVVTMQSGGKSATAGPAAMTVNLMADNGSSHSASVLGMGASQPASQPRVVKAVSSDAGRSTGSAIVSPPSSRERRGYDGGERKTDASSGSDEHLQGGRGPASDPEGSGMSHTSTGGLPGAVSAQRADEVVDQCQPSEKNSFADDPMMYDSSIFGRDSRSDGVVGRKSAGATEVNSGSASAAGLEEALDQLDADEDSGDGDGGDGDGDGGGGGDGGRMGPPDHHAASSSPPHYRSGTTGEASYEDGGLLLTAAPDSDQEKKAGAGEESGRSILKNASRRSHRLVDWDAVDRRREMVASDEEQRRSAGPRRWTQYGGATPAKTEVSLSGDKCSLGSTSKQLRIMETGSDQQQPTLRQARGKGRPSASSDHDDGVGHTGMSEHGSSVTSGRSVLGSAMVMAQGSVESQIVMSNRFLCVQALFVLIMGVVVTVWTRNFVVVLKQMSNTVWLAGRRQLAFLSAENKLMWMANRNDIGFLSHYEPMSGDRVLYPPADQSEDTARRLTNYNLTLVNREALHDPFSLQDLMLYDADEVQDAHGRLYVAIEKANIVDTFENMAKLPIQLPEESGGGVQFKTVGEQLHELVAAYRRVAKGAVAAITRGLRDVQFVLQNAEEFDLMMSFATRRHKVRLETDIEAYGQQVFLFGAVTTGVMLLLGGSSFVVLLRQLGAKTEKVLQVFMLISQSQAKHLTQYSQKSLENVLRETQSVLQEEGGEQDGTDLEDENDVWDEEGIGGLYGDDDAGSAVLEGTGIDLTDSGKDAEVAANEDDGSVQRRAEIKRLQSGLRRSVKRVSAAQGLAAASDGPESSVEMSGTRSIKQARLDLQQRALDRARKSMRPFTNSSTFVCKSIACLLLPVTTVIIFAGAILLIQTSLGYDVGTLTKRCVIGQSLQARTQLLSTRMQIMAEDVYQLYHVGGANADALKADIMRQSIKIATGTRIIEQLGSMLTMGAAASADMLLFADGERGDMLYNTTIRHTSVQGIREDEGGPSETEVYDVLHRDGCNPTQFLSVDIATILRQRDTQQIRPPVARSRYVGPVGRDCRQLQDGVVAEGLMSAFASWTFEARDFAARVYSNVTDGMQVQDALEEVDLNTPRFLMEAMEQDGNGRHELGVEADREERDYVRRRLQDRAVGVGSADLQVGRNRTLGSLNMAEFSLYEADKLRDLFSPYMQHALDANYARFYLSMTARLHDTGRNIEIATWVFAGFFFVTTLVYMAQLKLLQLPLRAARQMLVLLPQPLLQGHVALQAAVKETTREMQSGSWTETRPGTGGVRVGPAWTGV